MQPMLTVYEAMLVASNLKLGNTISKKQKQTSVSVMKKCDCKIKVILND